MVISFFIAGFPKFRVAVEPTSRRNSIQNDIVIQGATEVHRQRQSLKHFP